MAYEYEGGRYGYGVRVPQLDTDAPVNPVLQGIQLAQQQQGEQQRLQMNQLGLQQAQQAQTDRAQLNQLASQAYSTAPDQRTSLLGQMAAIDPNAAAAQQGLWARMDKSQKAQVQANMEANAQHLAAIAQDPDPQRQQAEYNALIAKGEAAGKDMSMFKNVPPKVGARMALMQIADAKTLLQANGMGPDAQPKVVGNALVTPTGQVLYRAPQQDKFVQGSDFYNGQPTSFDPRTGHYLDARGQIIGGGSPPDSSTMTGPDGKTVAFQFAPGTPDAVKMQAQQQAAAQGDIAAPSGWGAKPSSKSNGVGGTLSQDALDMLSAAAAQGFKVPTPPMGMGNSAARVDFYNTLAKTIKDKGQDWQEGVRNMVYGQTGTKGADTAQKTYASTIMNEAGAENLAEQALKLSQGYSRGNIPMFNAWVNAGRHATGNADIDRFNNAVNALAEDYAKVITGANGSAAATDSARKLAHDQLSSSQSPAQFEATVNQMLTEMRTRTAGQLSGIRKQIGGLSNFGNDEGAPASQAPVATNPQTGQKVTWNGSAWVPVQ